MFHQYLFRVTVIYSNLTLIHRIIFLHLEATRGVSSKILYCACIRGNPGQQTELKSISVWNSKQTDLIKKKLAGSKWRCMEDSLNITYNTYVKPIMKYGSEVEVIMRQG